MWSATKGFVVCVTLEDEDADGSGDHDGDGSCVISYEQALDSTSMSWTVSWFSDSVVMNGVVVFFETDRSRCFAASLKRARNLR